MQTSRYIIAAYNVGRFSGIDIAENDTTKTTRFIKSISDLISIVEGLVMHIEHENVKLPKCCSESITALKNKLQEMETTCETKRLT